MKYVSSYSGLLNIYIYSIVIIFLPFIIFESPHFIFIFLYYFLYLILVLLYLNFFAYRVEINDKYIYKIYLFYKNDVKIEFCDVSKVIILRSSMRSPPTISIYYNNKKVWFICSDGIEIDRLETFFKEKNIAIQEV